MSAVGREHTYGRLRRAVANMTATQAEGQAEGTWWCPMVKASVGKGSLTHTSQGGTHHPFKPDCTLEYRVIHSLKP